MNTARALTENLAALLRREHDALAEFLVALAAFDRDRIWVALGYPSLFDFLHRELRLSRRRRRRIGLQRGDDLHGLVAGEPEGGPS